MEQRTLQNVNNCLNTNIYSYLETSGVQSYHLSLNVIHFFNTSVTLTSVAAYGSCFPALVSNMSCSNPCCSIGKGLYLTAKHINVLHSGSLSDIKTA